MIVHIDDGIIIAPKKPEIVLFGLKVLANLIPLNLLPTI